MQTPPSSPSPCPQGAHTHPHHTSPGHMYTNSEPPGGQPPPTPQHMLTGSRRGELASSTLKQEQGLSWVHEYACEHLHKWASVSSHLTSPEMAMGLCGEGAQQAQGARTGASRALAQCHFRTGLQCQPGLFGADVASEGHG